MMKAVRFLVLLLMVVGSLNWGLVGFFQYDLISDVFGGMSTMGARVIFGLVGIAGILGIGFLCRCCGCGCSSCDSSSSCSSGSSGCSCGCKCCGRKNREE